MSERYDTNSLCGIHVRSTRDRADAVCVHCARAALANAAALADVVQMPANAGRRWRDTTPPDVQARILDAYAAGDSIARIARANNVSASTVSIFVGTRARQHYKPRPKSEQGIKGSYKRMWSKGSKAQRDADRATALPRHVHL